MARMQLAAALLLFCGALPAARAQDLKPALLADIADEECAAGADEWRAQWSQGKRVWCCLHERKACVKVTEMQRPDHVDDTEPDYDCHEAAENWEMAWSRAKRNYCCSHIEGGCRTSFSQLFGAPGTLGHQMPSARPALMAPAGRPALLQTPSGLGASLIACTAAGAGAVSLAVSWRRSGQPTSPTRQGYLNEVVPLVS